MKRNVHFSPELHHLIEIPEDFPSGIEIPVSYRWIQGLRLLSTPDPIDEQVINRFGSFTEVDGNVFFVSQHQEGNGTLNPELITEEIDIRTRTSGPIVYRNSHIDSLTQARGRLIGSLVERIATDIPSDLKTHLINTGLVRGIGRTFDDFLWLERH